MKLIAFTIVFFNIITQTIYSQGITYNLEIEYTIFFNTERPNSQQGVLYLDNLRAKSLFIYGKNTESNLKQNEDESGEYYVFQGGKKKVFYHDKTKDTLISRINIFSEQFLVEENIPQLKWVIHNEEKMLDKHLLKKATLYFRGRNYVAWYSEEYPLAFGPWKFSGLPGLIMEIYDETKRYHWQINSIKQTEDTYLNLEPILKAKETLTLKQYADRKFNNNDHFKRIASKLPKGFNVTQKKIARTGFEIKFEWEEEEKKN
jgi:GLPGLI family protein